MTATATVASDYIEFVEVDSAGLKTQVWDVVSKSSGHGLGQIRWYGAWRQYCFYPVGSTIWNTGCLQAVQAFIQSEMLARRQAKARV